uniref:t-SNARE coiled-coil homology domain-containing protein n=1 Tax=Fagus sylvatica TaxID=28930 RepID=A0A2N9J2Z2_FAGSY
MSSSYLPATTDSIAQALEANTPEAISNSLPCTSDLQISLCKEMVQWTRAEKRTFLRQRVEARLAALLMESKEYSEALTLLSSLIKEVRRLDDKLLLVDIDLLESKLHFSLRNLPKAKASLTAARTAANAIYVPPAQQGTIDLQSGILHAEEKDYKTAYSYFFEAFEAFNALEEPRAVFSLKYMLLCKIMVNQADDVKGIISSKAGLQYVGPELDAMKAVADAYSKRSLKLFETALRDFKAQLEEDPIVHRHLSSLVEIAHIAELIELPVDHVEKKLSQMIELDKKFAGTLDQGAGCLIIFDDPKTRCNISGRHWKPFQICGKVVDSLYVRVQSIMFKNIHRKETEFVLILIRYVGQKEMSEVFEGYERQYCELSANLSRKCSSTALLPHGEQKQQKVSEIKAALDDADVLIRKMDLEARSLQPSAKAMMLAKLREYKSDLNKLKREFKKVASPNANQASREELMESGMDLHTASADQRERMVMSVERLNQSSERIKESRRTILETEELGVSILEDLHQQRETLLHSHQKLHGVDDAIDKSKKVLTAMSRRMTKHKWIIGSVVGALVIAIIFILFYKFSHH